ncbi:MAG TPA: nucleotidyltransferase family protein [Methanospirillum sp.]|nr:nucleotidyltransferase family protein [Methanospirillum sp.]
MSSESIPTQIDGERWIGHRPLIVRNRKEILAIASRYGAYNIRLCGSVARGDDTPMSDIDLLVDMEQGKSLLDLGSLLMDLQDLLGCKVDILTEKGLKNRIRERVLKDAVYI